MIGRKSGLRSRGYLARVRALPAPTNHINGKWHSAAQLGSAYLWRALPAEREADSRVLIS